VSKNYPDKKILEMEKLNHKVDKIVKMIMLIDLGKLTTLIEMKKEMTLLRMKMTWPEGS
jgi:hypothetical protein